MFCQDFESCINLNDTCAQGLNFTLSTGCPTKYGCDFGAQGIAFVGNPSVTGGTALDGSITFNAPANYPCYLALINDKEALVKYNLIANNVKVSMMSIAFPNSDL